MFRPEVRVGLVTGADSAMIGGAHALEISAPDGRRVLELPERVAVTVRTAGTQVWLRLDGGIRVGPESRLRVSARDPGGVVRLDGRDYRGALVLVPAGPRLTVVNQVDIESYLAGVVNAEMGRRAESDQAALEAQAVVSRTFALRALSRSGEREFDLLPTVAHQVYRGVAAELPQGWRAIEATGGLVLVWDGQPIESFFHSTCGGRTAAGEEVFANGERPYLRSVPDLAPDGSAWCAISPRFRWTERWDAAELDRTLRRALPAGTEASALGALREVRVNGLTPSRRVRALLLRYERGEVPIEGSAAVRQALAPAGGDLLRSAAFSLHPVRRDGRLLELVAEGGGAGHGVGFCQWGAVGRARAGASREEILRAYFPATVVERRW